MKILRIAAMLVIAVATPGCLDTYETSSITQHAETPVDTIHIENETGVAIGITLKYKGADGKQVLVSSFIGARGATSVTGVEGKIEFVDLTVSGGGNTYKKKDNGTDKRDTLTRRKWSIVKADNRIAPGVVIPPPPPEMCSLAPTFPTDVEGEPMETIPGDGCSPCLGCPLPDPEPDPGHEIITTWPTTIGS